MAEDRLLESHSGCYALLSREARRLVDLSSVAAKVGFEPTKQSCFKDRRLYQFADFALALGEGVEPPSPDSESGITTARRTEINGGLYRP
jgi:hypothetical protein